MLHLSFAMPSTKYSISIITPWHNNPHLISEYEQSVRGAQVIIVDNASDDTTSYALESMVERLGNRSMYIRNDENAFFSAANDQGATYANYDTLLFLNNDIQALPGWLQSVERDCESPFVIGPSTGVRSVDGFALQYIEGWCIAMQKVTFELIGGWDSDTFKKPYWEDNWLCFRALVNGVGLLKRNWQIRHLNAQTSKMFNSEAGQWIIENERLFKLLVRKHMIDEEIV